MVSGYISMFTKEETDEFVKVNHLTTMESSSTLIPMESKTCAGYLKTI